MIVNRYTRIIAEMRRYRGVPTCGPKSVVDQPERSETTSSMGGFHPAVSEADRDSQLPHSDVRELALTKPIDNPYSRVIEQMARRRRVPMYPGDPNTERPRDGKPQAVADDLDRAVGELGDHERLRQIVSLRDPVERDEALQELQVMVERWRAHVQLANLKRTLRNRRAIRRRRSAAHRALERGRPKGAVDFALRQYGLEAAMFYWKHTGRLPSPYEPRIPRNGSYAELLQLLVRALPPSLRRALAGKSPALEYLLDKSVEDFRRARWAEKEYRRRGLIDEHGWLHRDGAG